MTPATASLVDVLVGATTDVFETMIFRHLEPRETTWGHAARPKSQMVGCAILFAKFVNRKEFVKMEKQTQEMVRLLEEATAKRGQPR